MERLKAQSLIPDSLLNGPKLILWIHHVVQRAFDNSFWPPMCLGNPLTYDHYLVKHLEDLSRMIQDCFDRPHLPYNFSTQVHYSHDSQKH